MREKKLVTQTNKSIVYDANTFYILASYKRVVAKKSENLGCPSKPESSAYVHTYGYPLVPATDRANGQSTPNKHL